MLAHDALQLEHKLGCVGTGPMGVDMVEDGTQGVALGQQFLTHLAPAYVFIQGEQLAAHDTIAFLGLVALRHTVSGILDFCHLVEALGRQQGFKLVTQ